MSSAQPLTGVKSLTGMRGFLLVWVGQVISLLGTGMTNFGIAVWAFELTGQATALALIGVAYAVPSLIMMPLAQSRRKAFEATMSSAER